MCLYYYYVKRLFFGGFKFLVSGFVIFVIYYDGFILVGKGGVLKVYVIYYGVFVFG